MGFVKISDPKNWYFNTLLKFFFTNLYELYTLIPSFDLIIINSYIYSVEYNISPENDPEGILEDYSR